MKAFNGKKCVNIILDFYEIYQVSLKKSFGFGATISQQVALIFSVVGIMSIVLLWPVFVTLYFTGVEIIVWSYVPWELVLFALLSFLCKQLLLSAFRLISLNPYH
jgi:hypothetical protein